LVGLEFNQGYADLFGHFKKELMNLTYQQLPLRDGAKLKMVNQALKKGNFSHLL
jgi:hypothetical protein